ncbi:hypothetical protein PGTUg99_012270 [Puccinia graminis f. sp. tritici]|uniref:Uncharacterized protein n=1 Tax=Puccinia graminis f. sp. tritici TaxID=56615 RepID=A0A5B0NGY0_PUCGR|nr:hypothetical protein PGTUg99_012270 [Puccinia graminis f. sp. tritici]
MGLLVHWIEHKYHQAARRKEESTIKLDSLSKLINPFVSPRATYDLRFFEEQWNHQRQFQLTHSDADRERQERLAMFLDREASLNRLRAQLNQMTATNSGSYDDIVQSLVEIASSAEQQRGFASELPGEYNVLIGQDAPRRRLQLLLWHSKSALYTHAVELFSERQPLYRGTHIGTTLSTRIIAAIDRRKGPIETAIRKYNGYRADYLALLLPNETQPDIPEMTYWVFVNLSLDDAFWQDVYLYHSRAPWAVNSDVRSGIHAMLISQRADEEFALVRHEFLSAISWAVNHHAALKAKITVIDRFISELSEDDDEDMESEDSAAGVLTSISLGDCGNSVKAELLLSILNSYLTKHEALMRSWSTDVESLWKQLHGNGPQAHEWFRIISTLKSADQSETAPPVEVGGRAEEVIDANEGVDDEEGEEVEASDLINHIHINPQSHE